MKKLLYILILIIALSASNVFAGKQSNQPKTYILELCVVKNMREEVCSFHVPVDKFFYDKAIIGRSFFKAAMFKKTIIRNDLNRHKVIVKKKFVI